MVDVSNIPLDRPGLRCARQSPLECVESWRPFADSAQEPFMDFAAGVAHDLRNLFAIVSTTAQDMLVPVEAAPANVAGETPDHAAGLRAIVDAAKRGGELAAQLQGGVIRNTATAERIDVNEVVRGVMRLARRITNDRIAFLQRLDPAGA